MTDKKEINDEALTQTTGGCDNEHSSETIHINGLEAIGPYAVGGINDDKLKGVSGGDNYDFRKDQYENIILSNEKDEKEK